ncbi:unnamed protein product [Urochloa humidicola]
MGSSPSSASPDKFEGGQERSPRSSPLRSPVLRLRIPRARPSPVHPKFLENHVSRPDGYGSASFHPLPLPPASVSPKQTNSSHQTVPKVDMPSVAGQWQKGKLIGSGTFGCVYEATNRHTGALCAMKEINIIPEDAKSVESLKQLEQEIKFLSQFKHENIVQYYGSETTEDRFYIYLEYVHPGSIHKYVHQHCGSLTESVIRNFTRHILKGLAFLHSQKIMHRDIKGANLLVDINGVVKLADFGMAKHLSTAAPNLSLKGTPYWMAPEVVRATFDKSAGYDLAADIWSLSCTIIEMFTGKPPWSGLEGPAAMFKVLHTDPPIPDNLSPEGKDFLRCCFKRNPAERPTASKLLEHPFICTPYNQYGSTPSFAASKSPDTGHSGARDKVPWKNDSGMRGKHANRINRTTMESGVIRWRFGRCPYCRAMIYQDLEAVIYYCSKCRTPIRGKNLEASEENALSRLEILSGDTASVFSDELDAFPKQLPPLFSNPNSCSSATANSRGDTLRGLIAAIEPPPSTDGATDAEARRGYRLLRRLETQTRLARTVPPLPEQAEYYPTVHRNEGGSSAGSSSTAGGRGERRRQQHHCRPVQGGAPFVVCCHCFGLLLVPATRLLSRRKVARLRCGRCDEELEVTAPTGVAGSPPSYGTSKTLSLALPESHDEGNCDGSVRGGGAQPLPLHRALGYSSAIPLLHSRRY